jgi:hypothetical protein
MKRTIFIFVLLLVSVQAAYAQIPLTGKVFDADKHTPLPSIKVQNTRTRDNTMTNAAGIFTIQVKNGDILVLDGFSFQTDTVVVTNARYLEINMKLGSKALNEVKIQNTTTKLGSLKDPDLHNQPLRYQVDANGVEMGGIALKFGYGKGSKERKEELLAYNQLATQEIDKAFSPDNIGKYVPLKGKELKQFIGLYRPTIKQYRDPAFDLPLYLNECYKKFVLLTPAQRKLPPLKADSLKNKP